MLGLSTRPVPPGPGSPSLPQWTLLSLWLLRPEPKRTSLPAWAQGCGNHQAKGCLANPFKERQGGTPPGLRKPSQTSLLPAGGALVGQAGLCPLNDLLESSTPGPQNVT